VPEQHGRIEDLQSHARALALELRVANVSYDTLVRKIGESSLTPAWELPAMRLPTHKPLALTAEGVFPSEAPRFTGREVRPLDERDVLPKKFEQGIRQSLYAMEKKHDIFNRLKRTN